ncbi:phosphoenolpyruvate--protein phosphotransferase [Azorhizobium oxalatiphilum]|uniref:phosphoenolpyruvate--protein phosphotransferase n=1 Tax=Azorhizobium oxalatiphilum TaxID=980631 RepID=A0A917C7Z3_9HYPH|nr:phosphoenolpyruvate--protein phosphotransferase [Azorhizobium oxalatiphilum]GGF75502.1 phosphoenolpyruvate--protein phosphotransferase [Azorhizobium oxalatiphilum]
MRGALGGPRVLLRRLREVMAEPISAQDRLDKIVVLIAANMVAEVCSVYVLRVDATLELYATEGLNRDAVHLTVMRTDEGLVGHVAREAESLALSDAQNHPEYSYRPETGEEIYNSFLGVPILRGGNTLGVLVVQNRARRTYTDEEIEALQTTAMVMAEMIASGELTALAKPGAEPAVRRPLHLTGTPLADGLGLGHVVLHEPRVVITNVIADDVQKETDRLDGAIGKLRASIDLLLEEDGLSKAGEHREILEAYRMFAHDRGWMHRMREAVHSGLTAEGAVERVQSDTRARIMRASDPYLRERLHDLDDLANRLLRELTGRQRASERADLPENAILVARNMSPAALLDYDRDRIRGLVLEEGGTTSHVTIVARALGIAAVGQVENATSLADPGDPVIVDGLAGQVHLRPPGDVEEAYAEKVRFRAKRQARFAELRDRPSVTRDGVAIDLMLNAGLLVDLPHIGETAAAGIGLFRTELQFMVASTFPRISEQLALYRAVLDAAGDRPVTFRTLDIGGDKVLPYMRTVEEENPALGWRAIRLGLDRPGLLRSQIRALLRAAAGRELRVMFPMVADVHEFDAARTILERELTHLRKHGHALPEKVHVGAMVEVPSLLFQLDEMLTRADFLSVGSNDLVQFLFAADRSNVRVADRFDPLSPAALRAFRMVAEAGLRHGKPVTLCGELASRPLEAIALAAVGFRALSLSPASVGPVKSVILDLDVGAARALLLPLLEDTSGAAEIRAALRAFAEDAGLPL